MMPTHIESVLQRDRRIVLFSLFAAASLAWLYLALMAHGMDNGMTRWRASAWTAGDFVLMFIMWVVMMLGMMLPSASPMTLLFSRVTRTQAGKTAAAQSRMPIGFFVAGYAVIWSGFSLAATIVQWALQNAGLLSPMMASTNVIFSSSVLIAVGVYQWTPLKHACLRRCQTPLGFLMTSWRDGVGGAFHMGLAHGAYCVGCCWALMLLLFVGGVMDLAWVAVLATLVLVEKIAPPGPWMSRVIGMALIAWGGWVQTVAILR